MAAAGGGAGGGEAGGGEGAAEVAAAGVRALVARRRGRDQCPAGCNRRLGAAIRLVATK